MWIPQDLCMGQCRARPRNVIQEHSNICRCSIRSIQYPFSFNRMSTLDYIMNPKRLFYLGGYHLSIILRPFVGVAP